MPEDFDYVAESFHGLIADVQANELRDAEKRREDERNRALELRHQAGAHTLNASELLVSISGNDPEKQQRKLDAENDRILAEAADAAAKVDVPDELPADRFPPPILTP